MDMIATTGFALDVNAYDYEKDSSFIEQAKSLLKYNFTGTKMLFVCEYTSMRLSTIGNSVFFPWIKTKLDELLGKDLTDKTAHDFFGDVLDQLYQQRIADKNAKEVRPPKKPRHCLSFAEVPRHHAAAA